VHWGIIVYKVKKFIKLNPPPTPSLDKEGRVKRLFNFSLIFLKPLFDSPLDRGKKK